MKLPANVEGRAALRLFIGLPLPDAALTRLVGWQRDELEGVPDIRPLRPEQLHVTLAFLGSRPQEELEAISEATRESAVAAKVPDLIVSRYRETRSVGMLVFEDPGGRAAALADDLQERLEQLGAYRREKRPWLPHVTVLRFRERPRLEPEPPDLGVVSPSEAAVYHSVLRPTGAQYEVLQAHALGR